jgi:hypothetical protein
MKYDKKQKKIRVVLNSEEVGFTGAASTSKYPKARTNHGTNLLHGLLQAGVSFDQAMKVALGVKEANSWESLEPQWAALFIEKGTSTGRGRPGDPIITIPPQSYP